MSKQCMARWLNGEHTDVKRQYNYFKEHYDHILQSDAILIVNNEKKGVANYIGGNVLIEMGQAYVNNKKIFFLNAMPFGLPYNDEIEALDPVCLFGDLSNIQSDEPVSQNAR